MMTKSVAVRFDIIWRTAAKTDTVLATVTHTFDANPPGPGQLNAVKFETDLTGIAAPATPGELLVLKFNTVGGSTGAFYIPNGDGALVKGRIPNLTLP